MDDSTNALIEGEYDATDKDGFSLIDGSELDDLFVSMSESSQGDDKVNMVDGGLNVPERLEAEKPKKNGKCNLRKSLAWDSAFFTSAGVLDAEELSSIIEGGNGGKHQHLPGIQEDVSNSTDSLSTLESDNLTLESLEADLFSDIRASIQRSGEASRSRNSNLNDRLEDTCQLGKKTFETKHGSMVRPKSTPKKLNTNLQGNGKLMKVGPSREQVRKPVGSRKEPTSCIPKPVAASAKGSTNVMVPVKVPTKRLSMSAGRIKSDTSHLGIEMGRAATASKGDRTGDPRSIIPKGASHSKSSSVSSTIPKAASYAKSSSVSSSNTRTGISSTRTSYDSTSSSSSQSSRILPLNGMQGKAIKPASVFPPAVKSRIPSRVPLKSKNPPSNSRILAKLSASTLSSSVSPTSSISEWSSCSSTVTANQEHSASTECSSLHRTFSLDSNASQDLQTHPNQQGSRGDEEVAFQGNISVSNPVSSKPSGLRMPSPKIGFFDGVKSGGRTQNAVGSTQSRSRLSSSRLPRSTPGNSSPGGVQNRGRIGHGAAKSTPLAGQNSKSDTGRSNSRVTDGGHLEGMLTAEESNIASSEDFTKTTSLKTSEENNSGPAKLPVGEKQLPSARKKSGFICSSKNAIPQGKSNSLTNQVRSSVEADHHVKEMNSLSIELKALHWDELIIGDTVNTELSINMSEEVGNGSKLDGDANTIILFGKKGSTNGKNDLDSTVINMSEEAGNATKADENAVQSEECQTDNEKNDLVCTVINMSEEAGNATKADENAVQSEECQTDNEKNDPDCTVINMSEEAGNATKADENAVQSEECQTHNEKIDLACTVINMSEEAGNASKADENAVQSDECQADNEKNDLACTVINMSEEAGTATKADENAVQSDGCQADNEKNDLACTVINMFEEAGTATKADENAVQSDECQADNEKNDLACTLINMSEEAENASKADENAVQSDEYQIHNEKNDLACTVISMSEEAGNASKADENAVQSEECQTDNEKSDPLRVEINASEEAGNSNNSGESADTVLLKKEILTDEKNVPVCISIDMFGELGSDDNADTDVQSGGYEETTEKIDLLCTEVNISEEVGNASNVDDCAYTVRLSGECEAPSENNEPICAEITDQQNAFPGKLIVEVVRCKRDGYSEPQGNTSSVCDSHSPVVSSAVELSMLKEERNSANLHKQTDICLSSKIVDSSPCARRPFADKNSSSGGLSVDFLVKRFTSLSLDNIQGKDVETGTD